VVVIVDVVDGVTVAMCQMWYDDSNAAGEQLVGTDSQNSGGRLHSAHDYCSCYDWLHSLFIYIKSFTLLSNRYR
jgi:hypothetical protein